MKISRKKMSEMYWNAVFADLVTRLKQSEEFEVKLLNG